LYYLKKGAINPFKETEILFEKEYIVNKMPKSMNNLVLNFDKLSEEDQKEFIEVLFSSSFFINNLNETEKNIFKDLIIWSQLYIEKLKLNRIHVSLRDIIRCITLYNFFTDKKNSYIIFDDKDIHKNLLIILVVIGMVYWFRLPSESKENINYREEFYKNFKIKEILDLHMKDYSTNETNKINLKIDLKSIMKNQLEFFYDNVEKEGAIPLGIAKTQALMENIFSNFVCLQSTIPLFIIGPPGTSKTLSYNITSKIGPNSGEYFKNSKIIQGAMYQCTEYSTSSEIESVFKNRLEFLSHFEGGVSQDIPTVFLDEGGLPKEK
jgi:E3 ubiquitin-protein ligase RNF213